MYWTGMCVGQGNSNLIAPWHISLSWLVIVDILGPELAINDVI